MEITPIIKDDFLEFEDTTILSEMLGKLRQFDKRAGLVFRNGKYVGLIERKKLLKTSIDITAVTVAKFLQRTPILNIHDDLHHAAAALFDAHSDYLPVEDQKEIVGVIYALDVVNATQNISDVSKMNLSDVKLIKPPKIEKDHPIAKVIEIMRTQRVDQIPVFDKGKLYGVITFRDILRRYLNWSPKRDTSVKFNAKSKAARVDLRKISELPVENFSTNSNLIKIKLNSDLTTAISLMVQKRIRNLIVVDGNKYQGLLTLRNILSRISTIKPVKNYTVRYVGISKVKLTEHQKFALKRIVEASASKLQKRIKDSFNVTLHLREIRGNGKQREFDVSLKLDVGGKFIVSQKVDWDLERALHKCFETFKSVAKRREKK